MRIWGNVLRQDLKRALCSRSFVLTILLMLSVELLSCGQPLYVNAYSVVEVVDNLFSGTGSADLLLMMFPLLPYALEYAREEQERAVTFWVVRVGAGRYAAGKFIASCVAAFCSVLISFALLCVVLLVMGHPLYRELGYEGYGYIQFLAAGRPVAFLTAYLSDRGLSAAMMAGCAVCLSSFYPNLFLTFTGPICIYFLVLRVFPGTGLPWMDVSNWMEGTYASPAGGEVSLLLKLAVALSVCLLYGIITVKMVRRRWRYA